MSARSNVEHPNAVEAEEYVLGAMMLSTVAIDSVPEVLRPTDFWRGSHQVIYEACLALHASGSAVDAVTVVEYLDQTGKLKEVGGTDRIREIASLVPAVSNAPHHARVIRDAAVRRSLITAGMAVAELGWTPGAETAAALGEAERIVFELAQAGGRSRSDLTPAREIVDETHARMAELAESGRSIIGVASGYGAVDALTFGWKRGNMIIVCGRPSMGKRLRFDAPILTPTGWRRNDELHVGDPVIGADGKRDVVLAVHDSVEALPFYRITFNDGTTVECCEDHLWLTRTRNERRKGLSGSARPTSEIAASLRGRGENGWNHSTPYVEPVEFLPCRSAPFLNPYWLGLYLGDGSTSTTQVRFTNPEPDLQRSFGELIPGSDTSEVKPGTGGRCETVTVRRTVKTNAASGAAQFLESMGLIGLRSHEKFVPSRYLYGSVEERLAVLQGLCDTDGYVTDPGGACVEFSTTSRHLRDDVVFIVGSLGGRATSRQVETHYVRDGERHPGKTAYRVVLSFPRGGITPVRSNKHLAKWRGGPHVRGRERFIVAADPIAPQPGRCITVGRGLYVTEGFVVTHNTALALGSIAHATLRLEEPVPVALFSLEMNKLEVMQRLISSEALVDSTNVQNPWKLSREEWERINRASARLRDAPLYVDETGSTTMTEIRSKARRWKLREPDGGLIVVDYVQLMAAGVKADNRNAELSLISRSMKMLAVELDVPVIVLSQLSRNVEDRHDKRPILSDLRDSGALEQDADLVLALYREEYYFPEEPEVQGIAEVNVLKQRNGPIGIRKLAFKGEYARFTDLHQPPGQ